MLQARATVFWSTPISRWWAWMLRPSTRKLCRSAMDVILNAPFPQSTLLLSTKTTGFGPGGGPASDCQVGQTSRRSVTAITDGLHRGDHQQATTRPETRTASGGRGVIASGEASGPLLGTERPRASWSRSVSWSTLRTTPVLLSVQTCAPGERSGERLPPVSYNVTPFFSD